MGVGLGVIQMFYKRHFLQRMNIAFEKWWQVKRDEDKNRTPNRGTHMQNAMLGGENEIAIQFNAGVGYKIKSTFHNCSLVIAHNNFIGW